MRWLPLLLALAGCARLGVLQDPRAASGWLPGPAPVWPRVSLAVEAMRVHPLGERPAAAPALARKGRAAFVRALRQAGLAGEVLPPGAPAPLRLVLDLTWEDDLDRLHAAASAATLTMLPVWRLARLRVLGRAHAPPYLLPAFRYEEEFLVYAHPLLLPFWPFQTGGAEEVLLERAGRALAAYLAEQAAFYKPPWPSG